MPGFDSPQSPQESQQLLSRVTLVFDSPLGSQERVSRVTRGVDSPYSTLGSQNCCQG
jgi:hypothetical protein